MAGLQVWDEHGKLVLDNSTRTTTYIAKLESNKTNDTLSFTDNALTQGTPFYIVLPLQSFKDGVISVDISGSRCTVRITDNKLKVNYKVYVGVY